MSKINYSSTSFTLQKLNKNFWSVFVFSLVFMCFSAFVFVPKENKAKSTAAKQAFDFLPTSITNQIVKHSYYTLSYSEKHEQAEWVAYELKKNYVKNNDFRRPYFIEDPKVKTGSADWRNYKKSGYDKGHLCPAGDMEF